jgi:hypothetical protein
VTKLVFATEFLLGDLYFDPTGTNVRTPEGKAKWAIELHHAVVQQGMAWGGVGPLPELELPPWGEHLAIRSGCATTPPNLERLQLLFPERRLRPFIPYGVATLDVRSPRGVSPVTLDVHLPPELWREADWRDASSGRSVDLTATDPTIPGAVVALTMRGLGVMWRSSVDPSVAPVEPSDGPLWVGVCQPRPVVTDAEHLEPVGKDGDQLLYLLTDPLSDPGEDGLTVYRKADTWPQVQAKAAGMKTPDVAARTGLSVRTCSDVIGDRPVSDKTKQIVAAALRYVGEVPFRTCPRVGCGQRVRPRRHYCSAGCKTRVESAEYQVWLHEQGAKQCRRCKAIRWGDLSGPCPNCRGTR